jgi:adenine phosphoribosyltransferase
VSELAERIRNHIEEIADFPKPGVRYRDITPILQDAELFRDVIDCLAERFRDERIDLISGVEARGFIFGAALAYRLGLGFIPIRGEGKLPRDHARLAFGLEYGFDALTVHKDAVEGGRRVLLVDDLLATGATLRACVDLVRETGGEIAGAAVVVEVSALGGRAKLEGVDLVALSTL